MAFDGWDNARVAAAYGVREQFAQMQSPRPCASGNARACSNLPAAPAAPGATARTTSPGCWKSPPSPDDGLNLAGIRRVLALQEETRRLHAEIARLKAARRPAPSPLATASDPDD